MGAPEEQLPDQPPPPPSAANTPNNASLWQGCVGEGLGEATSHCTALSILLLSLLEKPQFVSLTQKGKPPALKEGLDSSLWRQ